MKLLIIGTNLTVTDTIRKYTESKLEPLTKYKTVQDKQFKATISKLDHDEKQIKVNIDTLIATASDKDLEIVQPSDLDAMLNSLPDCKGVLTAGQLATEIFMRHYEIKEMPKMGQSAEFVFDGRPMKLYRMPSSSRAYPMQLEKKAEFYRVMFDELI